MSTTFNLPSWWSGASFTAKAGYLCATKHARDYSHACSLLAQRKRKKPKVAPVNIRLPYAD